MRIVDEQVIREISDTLVLKHYKKACMGVDRVFGVHPLSHAYSDIIKDLEEELLRRMK